MRPKLRTFAAAALAWGIVVWAGAFLVARSSARRAPTVGVWDASLDRFARLAPLAHWDSYWYWKIAEDGYETGNDRLPHTTAFFPMYPMLLRAVERASGVHPFLAGTPISLLCLAGAAAAIAALAADEGFDPRWSLAALLLFPKAVFFAAVYTESLFLMLSAVCLLALRRGRLGWAAVASALAGLARPTGVVLAVPIAWAGIELLRRKKADVEARSPNPGIAYYSAAALAPIAGAAAFGAYLWIRFGSPFAGVHAETGGWGRRLLEWPWTPIVDAFRMTGSHYWLSSLFLVPFAIGGILLFRRGLRAEAVYVLASILFVLETWGIASAPRYMAVLFPVFFLVGEAMKRWKGVRWTYAIAGVATLAIEVRRFALNYWVS